jgi:ParB-like chromosome segregation protein Spo0J
MFAMQVSISKIIIPQTRIERLINKKLMSSKQSVKEIGLLQPIIIKSNTF